MPASIDAGLSWLARYRERFAQKLALRWAIDKTGVESSIGTIGLTLNRRSAGEAELSFDLARRQWCRGVGTAAGGLVMDHALPMAEPAFRARCQR